VPGLEVVAVVVRRLRRRCSSGSLVEVEVGRAGMVVVVSHSRCRVDIVARAVVMAEMVLEEEDLQADPGEFLE
jgi:hypothetical protein